MIVLPVALLSKVTIAYDSVESFFGKEAKTNYSGKGSLNENWMLIVLPCVLSFISELYKSNKKEVSPLKIKSPLLL